MTLSFLSASLLFFCLATIALSRISSSTPLSRSSQSGHPDLSPDLRGNAFSLFFCFFFCECRFLIFIKQFCLAQFLRILPGTAEKFLKVIDLTGYVNSPVLYLEL